MGMIDEEKREELREEFQNEVREVHEKMEAGREEFREEIKKNLEAVKDEVEDFHETVKSDRSGATFSIMKRLMLLTLLPTVVMSVLCLFDSTYNISKAKGTATYDAVVTKTIVLLAVVSVLLIVTLVLSIVMARGITRSIKDAERVIKAMAEGDLNASVSARNMKRKDEIGSISRSLDDFGVHLRGIIANVKGSADILLESGNVLDETAARTSDTTTEISRAVEGVSRGAVTQAEEIENASSSIGDMGNKIEEIVASVAHLGSTSEQMKSDSDESTVIIKELSESNDKTTDAIHRIGKQVHATNDSVQTIRQAIEIITSIADETSLLSLNASIEAARAGEHGRGFAVVASEIQKLAEQSNASAQTIEQVIDNLLKESETTVEVMNEVEVIVAEQQAKLEETKAKFYNVTEGVDATQQETIAIEARTNECNTLRANVVDVIANLSAISQENAASTEETMASMEELNATISLLADSAGNLKELSENLNKELDFFQF